MTWGFLNGGLRGLAAQLNLYGDEASNQLYLEDAQRWAFGLGGDDLLFANPIAGSFLYGGNGNDRLYSGAQADYLNGGNGLDSANYSNSNAGVFVDLQTGTGALGYAQGDTLVNIEDVTGSHLDDTILGDHQRNRLNGSIGNDVLLGNGGDDRINGGPNGGTYYGDVMWGGAGNDSFVFSNGNASSGAPGIGFDVIRDFNQNGDDTIQFGTWVFTSETVQFSGEADNYSIGSSEIWYQKVTDPTYGDVTMVHAQLRSNPSQFTYYDIMLDGHMDLTADDFITYELS